MEASPLRPAIAGLGIIPFKPASALVAEEQEKFRKQQAAQQTSPLVSSLGGYIEGCWSKAKDAKDDVEQKMLKALRMRNGIYESDKQIAIDKMGGSSVYVLLGATKCRAAEAWINDVLRPSSERPWAILPTPIPDLPPEVLEELKLEAAELANAIMMKAQSVGMQMPEPDLVEALREYLEGRKDAALEEVREEAEKRAMRMADRIADQLAQGGWHQAFWALVSDFVTLPACVLKGPVVRKAKTKKWGKDATGKSVIIVSDELVPEFDRVSPFDLYPAPDSRHVNDGYLIQRHKLSRKDLQALIGVQGYSSENIRLVLRDYGAGGLKSTEPIDTERARLEFSGDDNAENDGEKIQALEFWGSVQGQMLIDWGLSEGIDPELDYEINAWKVGGYVIRAILNPDKLGRKPYSVASYERVAGSFWGKGIPELMADIQDICNAVARAIVNNSGLASGPQVEVDVDRCENEDEELWPWKIWKSTNQQMADGPAVRFNQPTLIAEPLLKVFEFFSTMSEDQTGVPRWSYGNTNLGGAGSTSSGLSMLMTHASRGIKEAIAHLDTMISERIDNLYDYNMLYDPDESIKGDCNIMARGSSALMAREQQTIRMRELLQATNNDADMAVLGLEGRAKMLKLAMKGMDVDVDDIIPDEEGIKKLVEKLEQKQAAMMQANQKQLEMKGQVPPPNGQTLDNAGNPAGGVDANLFQNQPGVTPGGMMAAGQ